MLAAEANRTLAQGSISGLRQRNKIAVWFLSSFQKAFQLKEQRQGQAQRKIERFILSHLWPKWSFLETVLNDSRKDLAKDAKVDLARLTWEQLGVLILNYLRELCFKLIL